MKTIPILVIFCMLISCATKSNQKSYKYGLDRSNIRELTMIVVQECLSDPWVQNFKKLGNRSPKMKIGEIKKQAQGNIDMRYFTQNIKKALINSGEITFPTNDTTKSANHSLEGIITSKITKGDDKRDVTYIVSLNVVNLKNTKVVWAFRGRVNKKFKKMESR